MTMYTFIKTISKLIHLAFSIILIPLLSIMKLYKNIYNRTFGIKLKIVSYIL